MGKNESVSIVLCGEAGQGIQTIEAFLIRLFKAAGYPVFATKEYMSRIRGGSNSTEIRVSSRPVAAYVDRIDLLIPLDADALSYLERRITSNTIILGEAAKIKPPEHRPVIDIPFSRIAAEIGNPIYANSVAGGVVAGLFGLDLALVTEEIEGFFGVKSPDIIQKNKEAAVKGFHLGKELRETGRVVFEIRPEAAVSDDIIVSGSEAVALGALAGGCNFVAAYPMSPGTGVLTILAQHAREFAIVAEQAEDEISAVNMALGAWYAGARAMVTTSGGGFALMTEGISLAGMIESPLVVHVAQRPGPATGLPARTEQADLDLVLYAGHGEFPRIILAPGNLSEAFYVAQKAFQLADEYQVPVFVLTDQFLVDTYYNVPRFALDRVSIKPQIVETTQDYRRYVLAPDGISPRGIPGYGTGLVGVDSDEHDEAGHLTEDLELRVRMQQKRMRKLEAIRKAADRPKLMGNEDYQTLVVGWGSSMEVIKEALAEIDRPELAGLHFTWVYPPAPEAIHYLRQAERIIMVENNSTGQFGKLLHAEFGVAVDHRILKYNGLPFSVEELVREIVTILTEE